jgi:hypothetical protein
MSASSGQIQEVVGNLVVDGNLFVRGTSNGVASGTLAEPQVVISAPSGYTVVQCGSAQHGCFRAVYQTTTAADKVSRYQMITSAYKHGTSNVLCSVAADIEGNAPTIPVALPIKYIATADGSFGIDFTAVNLPTVADVTILITWAIL